MMDEADEHLTAAIKGAGMLAFSRKQTFPCTGGSQSIVALREQMA